MNCRYLVVDPSVPPLGLPVLDLVLVSDNKCIILAGVDHTGPHWTKGHETKKDTGAVGCYRIYNPRHLAMAAWGVAVIPV